MKLVFIYGMPATGKLTVAKELSALTGYKLFHNHLVVDLLLEVFEFGTKPFVELREKMWLDVFRSASESEGLIFTFAPEKTVRQEFIDKTVLQVTSVGGEVIFVELQCDNREIEQRLGSDERRHYKKLASVEQFRQLLNVNTFDSPRMPEPQVRIDTSRNTARDSAIKISRFLVLK